jgi:phage I-like protein
LDPPGAQAPLWVMVLRTGAWLGHPTAPEVVTPEHLHAALDSFARHYQSHGADLVIDYHHGSVLAARTGAKAPAAGWIRAMELRNDGTELWGRVLWTAEAAAAIGRREFRYLSPVLRFGWPARVTGKPIALQIHSVALTNTPFLTELQSLNEAAATDGRGTPDAPFQGGADMSLMDSLAAALGRTPEQVTSALGLEGKADDAALAEALVANAARVTELEEQLAEAGAFRAALAAALDVTPEADGTALNAAVIRLKEPRAGLDAARTLLGLPNDAPPHEVLKAIGGLRQAQANADAERVVDAAVREGRVPPALRDFYLREALSDLEATRQVINALPPVLAEPLKTPGGRPAGRPLGEAEQSVCRQLGLSAEAFLAAQ